MRSVPIFALHTDINKNMKLHKLLSDSGFESSTPFGSKITIFRHDGVPFDQWPTHIFEKLTFIINSVQ